MDQALRVGIQVSMASVHASYWGDLVFLRVCLLAYDVHTTYTYIPAYVRYDMIRPMNVYLNF